MKKRKKPYKIDRAVVQNPVAKFAHQFNKSHVFCKKNAYRRKAKHVRQEVSPIAVFIAAIGETFCLSVPCVVASGRLCCR